MQLSVSVQLIVPIQIDVSHCSYVTVSECTCESDLYDPMKLYIHLQLCLSYFFSSLAASAPIWQFTGITPCEAFNQVLTNAFAQVSKTCVDNIRQSWTTLDSIGTTGKAM